MFSQIAVNIIITTSTYLLIAISFSLIYFTTKFFHLAHGAIITLGAYFTFLFSRQLSFPFLIAFFVSIFLAVFVGILCEILVYKKMRARNSPLLSYLIVSIGLYIIIQNCISLYFGDDTKIIRFEDVAVGNVVFGAYITTTQELSILVSIGLIIAINVFLKYSSTGKCIKAVSSNPELSNIFGISSNRIILIAFGLGSGLAAAAGILSAIDSNMTPTFGFNLLLYGIVAMIIGGVGNTKGLIAGALIVAIMQNLATYFLNNKWMNAATYIILILFLIWKPLGFSGNRLRKVEI